jgi:AraC-like DNA-binding protein
VSVDTTNSAQQIQKRGAGGEFHPACGAEFGIVPGLYGAQLLIEGILGVKKLPRCGGVARSQQTDSRLEAEEDLLKCLFQHFTIPTFDGDAVLDLFDEQITETLVDAPSVLFQRCCLPFGSMAISGLESGFESVEHFDRIFRRMTCAMPREYRQTWRS